MTSLEEEKNQMTNFKTSLNGMQPAADFNTNNHN